MSQDFVLVETLVISNNNLPNILFNIDSDLYAKAKKQNSALF